MRPIFAAITLVLIVGLSGCATPATVRMASDYEICRLSIMRPPLQSNEAIAEAERQIRSRGVNCGSYAGTILQRQDEGLRELQEISGRYNNQSYGVENANSSGMQAMTCYKTREWVSRTLKNCAYKCVGGEAVQTVGVAEICPISMQR